jgi:TonB family protein
MANAPLSMIDTLEDRATPKPVPRLAPSPVELNLLLNWPDRSRPEWAAIFGGSLALHILFFFVAIHLPSFIPRAEPEHRVIVKRIRLYVPPDILTQKAPNRQKISKSIDLADLLAQQPAQERRPSRRPSVKRFELPKQATSKAISKTNPQILPEAPKIALNQPPAPPPVGAANGLPAPAPPPTSSPGPFQNIGAEVPPNPHPALAPKTDVQSAVTGLPQNPNSRKLMISDENLSEAASASPGSTSTAGAPHAAVELQSDPQGTDFKPYLIRILAIVRANWRRVIPESARMGLLRGRTVMEFIIDRNGSIPKLVTADPSGSDALDRAAVAGLSMSNPLPPLPSDYKGSQVRLAFTFSYNMPVR